MSLVVRKTRREEIVPIERPIRLKGLMWSTLSYRTVEDAFSTLLFLTPKSKNVLSIEVLRIQKFDPASFDREVGNHFSLRRLISSCQQAPRQDSIRFALFAPDVSPVIVMEHGDKHTLLDGNHRAMAATIAHSNISAVVIRVRFGKNKSGDSVGF